MVRTAIFTILHGAIEAGRSGYNFYTKQVRAWLPLRRVRPPSGCSARLSEVSVELPRALLPCAIVGEGVAARIVRDGAGGAHCQAVQILDSGTARGDPIRDALAPPSAQDEKVLRQVVLSASLDCVARLAPPGTVTAGTRLDRHCAYVSCSPALAGVALYLDWRTLYSIELPRV